MIDLLVATTNAGKFAKDTAHLRDLPQQIRSLQSMAQKKDPPAVTEGSDGSRQTRFEKARTLARFSGVAACGGSCRLEVDALG